MNSTTIQYSDRRDLPIEGVVALYRANGWSSAEKPARQSRCGFMQAMTIDEKMSPNTARSQRPLPLESWIER
jgi:hypothetical protein